MKKEKNKQTKQQQKLHFYGKKIINESSSKTIIQNCRIDWSSEQPRKLLLLLKTIKENVLVKENMFVEGVLKN